MPPLTIATGAAPPRRRPSGSAWVSLLLLLAVAGVCYLGWVWVPIYMDHYEVKQVTRDFMNQAVKNRDDAMLVEGLSARLATVRVLKGKDEDGAEWAAPAVEVAPDAITWERDKDAKPPTLHVAFEYEREVVYPWTGRTTTTTFSLDLQQDIDVPVWDSK